METGGASGSQQAGSAAGMNTSGGSGQVPPQDPTPKQTGTQKLFFSRTFKHYLLPTDPGYTEVFKQGWCKLPYEHICASLKPRDWQYINVASKRWRVLSTGFNITHIIPFVNDKTTTGGVVGPHITFNMLPYIETYIDKGYQLPPDTMNDETSLPNIAMTRNVGDQQTSALKPFEYNNTDLYAPTDTDSDNLNRYNNIVKWGFDLMNSCEYGTVNPGEELSFEHKFEGEDLKWRHGLAWDSFTNVTNSTEVARPYGRWDGGINMINDGINYSNVSWLNRIHSNCNQPLPTCLLRPLQIHQDNKQILPIAFVFLVTYHTWIELDMNDIGFKPLYNRPTDANDTDVTTIYDIYSKEKTQGTGKKSVFTQWAGANACTRGCVTGPNNTGIVV